MATVGGLYYLYESKGSLMKEGGEASKCRSDQLAKAVHGQWDDEQCNQEYQEAWVALLDVYWDAITTALWPPVK